MSTYEYPNSSPEPSTVLLACLRCKEGKRKCDKILPSCSRCRKLGHLCRYEQITNGGTRLVENASTSLSYLSNAAFPRPSLGLSSTNLELVNQLFTIIGNLGNLEDTASRYFDTVHTWFPIVSESKYLERLPYCWALPLPNFGILSLSLLLITGVPKSAKSHTVSGHPELLTLVKTSIEMFENAGVQSIELLQSRILVALFEIGHGMHKAASQTIASTIQTALAMNIHKRFARQGLQESTAELEMDEEYQVWWGLVILDRQNTLERYERNQMPHDIAPATSKDLDDIWDQSALPLSTSLDLNVGPYVRQAQVSHLLSRVLAHVRDPTPSWEFNKNEAIQLAKTLTSFAVLLEAEAAASCKLYCGSIGMCNSALMMLYAQSPVFQTYDSGTAVSNCSLANLSGNVVAVANVFNDSLESVDMEALSPMVPHSLYKAAIIQLDQLMESDNLKMNTQAINHLDTLRGMLQHFSQRWKTAERYLEMIDMEYELRRKKYTFDAKN